MPSILSDDDKQTVKRTVPKASNKIHAVAVAKLYIALSGSGRWIFTGLQGAAVLADDLVGNTYWIKMVDVSQSGRGVIWDQEIYDTFAYNQDRTFFHSFEGEECMFGLSFADEKEAKQFLKKMNEREKNANKNTAKKPFMHGAGPGNHGAAQTATVGSTKSRFGGLFSLHKNNSSQGAAPAQSIIPPRGVELGHATRMSDGSLNNSRPGSSSDIDLSDPHVQAVLKELEAFGITKDQIAENSAFIKTYLEQNKATMAVKTEQSNRASRAPPPAPPTTAPTSIANLSPQNTGSSGASKRGPPPALPPSRRAGPGATLSFQRPPSPSPSPDRAPSPPRPRFRAPPPIADAGKYANDNAPPALPGRNRSSSHTAPGPPPPPRPPKTPLEESADSTHSSATKFAVPPPFEGRRIPSGPPPPPARSSAPAPPPREQPALVGLPPPPPPRNNDVPPPPPLPPSSTRPVPSAPVTAPSQIVPPPPPPLPPSTNTAAPIPPPPPPMPAMGPSSGGPPPPPMPPRGAAAPAANAAPALPPPVAGPGGRDGLLADIRGGARLRKVNDADKRDRSGAAVPGSESMTGPSASAAGGEAGAGGVAQGGLAGALANALAVRKAKVSHSDDEKDDDDW